MQLNQEDVKVHKKQLGFGALACPQTGVFYSVEKTTKGLWTGHT